MPSDPSDEWFTYRLASEEAPVEGIIKAVAAISNVDPTALDPLYPAIDPDALDSLFRRKSEGTSVEFTYAGYLVNATGDGVIKVREIDEEA
jgi:predicted RNA-binding protein with PUA-like domain